MIQVQIDITINPEKSKIAVNLLSREDATPEEYELAKAIEQLQFSVIESAGAKIKVTRIEDKRHLTQRVPDAGESAASQTLSPQSGESTPEVNPAATQRR